MALGTQGGGVPVVGGAGTGGGGGEHMAPGGQGCTGVSGDAGWYGFAVPIDGVPCAFVPDCGVYGLELGIVAPAVVDGVVAGVVAGVVVAGVAAGAVAGDAGAAGAPIAAPALIAATASASAACRPDLRMSMFEFLSRGCICRPANAARMAAFRELPNSPKSPRSVFAGAARKRCPATCCVSENSSGRTDRNVNS